MPSIAILLLEDSTLDADLTLNRLTKARIEHQTTRVETREAFTNALRNRTFDLILSDFALPTFDGLTALEIAQQQSPETPFIFVSGQMGEEVAIDSLKRGATDYVLKRRLDRLVPAVERALKENRERAERKQAEQRLAESEARFRELADAMPQIVFTALADGSVDYYNRRWYQFLGIEPEKPVPDWSSRLHPDDAARYQERWQASVSKGTPFDLEFRFQNPTSGEYQWFLGRALPTFDDQGGILRWYGTCTEIDTQKRIEEALRRSNEDLEQFAYVASHDLQEPLRTISSYSQLLARRYHGKLDEQAHEFIGFVVGAVARMSTLIQDLLAYSRATSQQYSRMEWTSSESALGRALANLRAAIDEKAASIHYEQLPAVVADAAQLTLLFQNLVGNALKYSREGVPPQVQISASTGHGEWIFTVRDNGVGFDPQYKERIFGLFKRLHGDLYSGTGIGLAMCKTVVERHGGRIWAVSEPGVGSTFFFTLPARQQPSLTT